MRLKKNNKITTKTFISLERYFFWEPFNIPLPDTPENMSPIEMARDLYRIYLSTKGAIANEPLHNRIIETPYVILFTTLNQLYAVQPLQKQLGAEVTLLSGNRNFIPEQPTAAYYRRLSLRYALHRFWWYYTLPPYQRKVYRARYSDFHRTLGRYRYLLHLFRNNKKIKYYIASNDHSGMCQLGYVAARKAGLKTIYVQHAAVSDLFPPLMVDYALLDGEDSKAKYLRAGHTHAKIFLIGTMKYDPYLQHELLDKPGELIGVCMGVAAHDLDKTVELCKLLKTMGIPFSVRFHPSVTEKTRAVFEREEWMVSLPENETALDFIMRCHSIISGDSTILLEAIVLKRRPVYFCSDGVNRDYYGFLKRGVLEEAYYTPQEVLDALNEDFDMEAHRKNAKWYCDSLYTEYEGRSTERAMEILRGLNEMSS